VFYFQNIFYLAERTQFQFPQRRGLSGTLFSDFRNLKITAFAVTDKLRFAKLENEKSIESEESLESRYWDNNAK
jgi:hypothetical protein